MARGPSRERFAGIKRALVAAAPKPAVDAYQTLRSLDAAAIRSWLDRRAEGKRAGDFPLPGLVRMTSVAGTANANWFLEGGQLAFRGLIEALGAYGSEGMGRVGEGERPSVLDFGCGCGRVARYWGREYPQIRFLGCDYDRNAVEWCTRNLPFGHFFVNRMDPPLNLDDESISFAYALSVFTHLPEELQRPWLDELVRVVKPGALVYFTTHGDAYLDQLSQEERRTYLSGELVVRRATAVGTNACGAYHPSAYVRHAMCRRVEVVAHLPEGAAGNPRQDVWIARKPSSPAAPSAG